MHFEQAFRAMDTKFWGPGGWEFLHTITFNYPESINEKNADDKERKIYTKQLFENLQYTLPCKYCRASFKDFLRDLPIDDHLDGRASLTYWFYEIHNKVNDKLRKQEVEAVEKKFQELEDMLSQGKITKAQAYKQLKTYVEKTMITDPDPSFEEICARYEEHRAGCSKQKQGLAVCRSPETRHRKRRKTQNKRNH